MPESGSRAGGLSFATVFSTCCIRATSSIWKRRARLGDVLVVSLTADKFVNKGPGRPLCKEHLRARTLAALSCVDYVVLSSFPSAADALEAIRPDIYCLGKDYETKVHKDELLQKDLATAGKVGAGVRYVGSVIFSATKLLNQNFDHLPTGVKDFCHALAQEFSMNDFRQAVESFSGLKVLVVGDTIFDRYTFVKVQGLTSKNRIISGRFLREETQCGGALAAFRHVRQFVQNVRFVSLLGTEPWVDPLLRGHIPPEENKSIRDPAFTTVIKQRFVEPLMEGKELSKLFSVNYIDAAAPGPDAQARLAARLREEIAGTDVVLLLDFGHGMMQEPIRQLVQETAPLLALNCQTNSNNHGFNIISRQYQRADAFSLDEQEMMLSCGRRHLDHLAELKKDAGPIQIPLRLADPRLGADDRFAGRGAKPVSALGNRSGGHHRRGRRLFLRGGPGGGAAAPDCLGHVFGPTGRRPGGQDCRQRAPHLQADPAEQRLVALELLTALCLSLTVKYYFENRRRHSG